MNRKLVLRVFLQDLKNVLPARVGCRKDLPILDRIDFHDRINTLTLEKSGCLAVGQVVKGV